MEASSRSAAPSPEAAPTFGLCGLVAGRSGAPPATCLELLAAGLGRHRAGRFAALTRGRFAAGLLHAGDSVGADSIFAGRELCVLVHGRPAGGAARVAELWRRLGDATPAHLEGDFALVVWDAERQLLFAARDPAAARPLVYAEVAGGLLFASEPAALLADRRVPRRADLRALTDFLVLDLHPGGHTCWTAIAKLPPGHRLSWRPGARPRVERWWRPEEVEPSPRRSDEEHAEVFAARLRAAVGRRMAAGGGRSAVLLSGGVDSSSVAALVVEAQRRSDSAAAPLAISNVFPTTPECDESGHAAAVAGHLGIERLTVSAEQPLFAPGAPGTADREPWIAGQLHLAAPLFAAAADAGAGAAFTGFGGDGLFDAARWRFHDDARGGRWWRLGPWIRARRAAGASPAGALAAILVRPLLPRSWVSWVDRHGGRWSRRQLPPWLPPATVRATGVLGRLGAPRLPRRHRGVRQLQFEHAVGLAQQSAALEGLEVAAAHRGLEVFHPLLDRRVAEYVLAAPLHLGARPGAAGEKWLLRAAVGGLLPAAVRERADKRGWGPYLVRRLRGGDGAMLLDLFRDSRCAALGLVDDAVLRRELVRFRAGDGPYGYGLLFLPPALVELWLRAGGAVRT